MDHFNSLLARFRVVIRLAPLIFSCLGSAAPGDEHWDSGFGWPGTTNWVYALAAHDNKLYASGFNPNANATNASVDVWDGTRWSSLAEVNNNLIVFDFAFLGHDVYVGGIFSGINGISASGLARWNGAVWSNVGGFRGAVFALATDGLNLYVGGVFTNAGDVMTTNVAKWNGSSWSALGAGLGPYTGGINGVSALLWSGTELYAGGSFSDSGGVGVPALARWDGSSWTAVGEGVNGTISALGWDGSSLFAGGKFTMAGGMAAQNIARWNGTAWSPLGSGVNSNVNAITVRGADVFVGGLFTDAGGVSARRIAKWDGLAWSALGVMNGQVNKLVLQGTNLYAGGVFDQADNIIVNHVGRWNGDTWGGLGGGSGLSFFGNKVAAGTNGIFAGGFFTGAGQVAASRIARWDGTTWSALGSGLKGTDSGSGTLPSALAERLLVDLRRAVLDRRLEGLAELRVVGFHQACIDEEDAERHEQERQDGRGHHQDLAVLVSSASSTHPLRLR